jgi:hypothetical protein
MFYIILTLLLIIPFIVIFMFRNIKTMLFIYSLSALISLLYVTNACWGYNSSEACVWSYFIYVYAFVIASSSYLIISFFQISIPKIIKTFKKIKS